MSDTLGGLLSIAVLLALLAAATSRWATTWRGSTPSTTHLRVERASTASAA